MWKSTDFLRHAVGETEERGAVTLTLVCEHCELFPVDDFLCWVYTNRGERLKQTQYEWLAVWSMRATVRVEETEQAASIAVLGTRRTSSWFSMLTEHQIVSVTNMITAPKLVTTLIKDNTLCVEVNGLAESSMERLAEALATFISVDKCKSIGNRG